MEQQIVDKVISLYKEGNSANKVAKILGFHKSTITYHLKRHNISMRTSKRQVSREIVAEMRLLRKNGMRVMDIAKKFNLKPAITSVYINRDGNYSGEYGSNRLSREDIDNIILQHESGIKIGKIAKQFGINVKTIYYHIKTKNKRKFCDFKHNHNLEFFEKIDTGNKAHVLGLFYSDGYNIPVTNTIGIELQKKDDKFLKKIGKLFTDRPLIYRDRNMDELGKKKSSCIIEVNNKHISKQLENLGVISRKYDKIVFPYFIGSDLYKHFIRGYFEGDGGVYLARGKGGKLIGKINIYSSSVKFLSELKEVIKQDLKIRVGGIYTLKGCSALGIYTNERTIKFLDWIYEDSEIQMERKYDKYLKLKNSIEYFGL